MLNRNLIATGVLVGLLLPLLTFAILFNLMNILEIKGLASGIGLGADFRERTTAILAIATNLLPLNVYRKRRWELSMRGVVISTTLLAVAWVFFYGLKML